MTVRLEDADPEAEAHLGSSTHSETAMQAGVTMGCRRGQEGAHRNGTALEVKSVFRYTVNMTELLPSP